MITADELQHTINLGKFALSINSKSLNLGNKGFVTERISEKDFDNIEANRKFITTILDSMGYIDSFLKSNKRSKQFDFDFLIEIYFELNKKILSYHIGMPLVEITKFNSVKQVFDLADKIDSAIRNSERMDANTATVFVELAKNTLAIQHSFEFDILSIPINQINYENKTRTDAELDAIRVAQENRINAISQQYSEGRADLLKSVEDYKIELGTVVVKSHEILNTNRDQLNLVGENLVKKEAELNSLAQNAEIKLAQVDGLLQKTSQIGMAGAFQQRREELTNQVRFWFVVFLVSLCVLTYIGVDVVRYAFNTASPNTDISIAQLVAKLAISFPAIWAAWFSAKQYGHSRQLQEDYAYKVSIAMTYHGYKDEAGLVDDKLSEKLLDSMIAQFSDNPVRLYQNNNSASVLEAMLKNDKFSDFINSAKNGVSGSAK